MAAARRSTRALNLSTAGAGGLGRVEVGGSGLDEGAELEGEGEGRGVGRGGSPSSRPMSRVEIVAARAA